MSNSKWTHEMGSEMMLDAAIADANLQDEKWDEPLTEREIRLIKELINPENYQQKTENKKTFLYDIVSNSRCSIDVDKFDYLMRDSHNVGIKMAFDPRRLLTFCRVIENQICFSSKTAYHVYELFHARYSLFKQVYAHCTGKAIEFMIRDVLLLADPVLNITSRIYSAENYLQLNDNILDQIELSTTPALEEARRLLLRLRKRNLYKIAFEAPVPIPSRSSQTKSKQVPFSITFKDIKKYASGDFASSLTEDDLIIQTLKLNYGKGDQNPVNYVKFYNPTTPDKCFTIERPEVSVLTPSMFEERSVRVFCRSNDSDVFATIKIACYDYFKSVFGTLPATEQHQPQTYDDIVASQQAKSIRSPHKSLPSRHSSLSAPIKRPLETITSKYDTPKKKIIHSHTLQMDEHNLDGDDSFTLDIGDENLTIAIDQDIASQVQSSDNVITEKHRSNTIDMSQPDLPVSQKPNSILSYFPKK